MAKLSAAERFFRKVIKPNGDDGCWLWTGAMSRPGLNANRRVSLRYEHQYRPAFMLDWQRVNGRRRQVTVPAFRFALSLADGVPLSQRVGLEAAHDPAKCSNPQCVNPNHGYWATPDENRRDRYATAAPVGVPCNDSAPTG